MGLFSKPQTGSSAARTAAADTTDVVLETRTKARRRLIGAAVLLGVGIVGFPLLFETQPRPIPVDIPIEIPSRDAVPPLVAPKSRPGAARVAADAIVEEPISASTAAGAGSDSTEPVQASARAPSSPSVTPAVSGRASEPRPAARQADGPASVAKVSRPPIRPAEKPVEKVEVKPASKPTDKVADKSVDKDKAAESGRWVVQIGAFSEVSSAREARLKVEAMGLKTYTQVIESSTGRRIRVRVGPYASKSDAERAAAKIKAGGLPTALLLL